MGSSSSKQSKESKEASRTASLQNAAKHGAAASGHSTPAPSSAAYDPSRQAAHILAHRHQRGSRPDLPFLGLVRDRENAQQASDRPRETKPERDARRAEKERQLRLKERERSMREEHIDGGYLVTVGVYTGPEDFDKGIVRQLQLERRLAPFWRGLNDHSNSWTEAQLVAAARGLPIPAPDEIPPDMARSPSQASSIPRNSDVNSLTVPITSRSQSHDSTSSANFSPSRPTFSSSGPTSPTSPTSSTAQLFRGRAKTLASLASGSKTHSPDLTPQEIRLPKDPYVNGQPIEAYLYKDASECPICFMYYPPYLNKTRCCDQAICSECFVQIKRPDPHPPEHEQPGQQRPPEEEAELLVSEVASCPFCVTPEFGITYDPPPFRRGLAYAKQPSRNPLQSSAMSSSSSLNTTGRRRTISLSATSPQVITTDRVRPDWAKKLADARAHVLRRSAAATALHNAAYVLGAHGDGNLRGSLAGFRRRRSLFDGAGVGSAGPGPHGLVISPYGHISRSRNPGEGGEDSNGDIFPPRNSSRRTRVEDLEDLMMMEAIRLSLAAEEDRKKKEDKEAKKDAKKKAKEEKKEAKQAEKMAKKGGAGAAGSSSGQMYQQAEANNSTSSWDAGSVGMARSSSNLGVGPSSPTDDQTQGKGKQPAQDFAGFIPLLEPTSTINTEMTDMTDREDDGYLPLASRQTTFASVEAQRHLEESRALLQPTTSMTIPEPSLLSPQHARQLSETPSVASSFNDSSAGSFRADSDLPSAGASGLDVSNTAQEQRSSTPPATEPMFNFRSLAAVIGNEDDAQAGGSGEHVEDAGTRAEEELKEPSPTGSPRITPIGSGAGTVEGNRSRGDSGESSRSAPPPVYEADGDQITPAPRIVHDVDSKEIGNIEVWGSGRMHEATQ